MIIHVIRHDGRVSAECHVADKLWPEFLAAVSEHRWREQAIISLVAQARTKVRPVSEWAGEVLVGHARG